MHGGVCDIFYSRAAMKVHLSQLLTKGVRKYACVSRFTGLGKRTYFFSG